MLPKCHSATEQKPLSPQVQNQAVNNQDNRVYPQLPPKLFCRQITQARHLKTESASLSSREEEAELNLPLTDSLRFSPHPHLPLVPLKTVTAEQNLWSWSQDMSLPSPQTARFSDESDFPFYYTCLSNYWFMSSEPPNLGLVTIQLKMLTSIILKANFH